MHGISPQQFAETIAAFLVPYYVVLAIMNGVAALYLWRRTEPVAYFRLPLPGITLAFTNVLLWTLVGCAYVILDAFAAAANLTWMPRMPQAFCEAVNERTGPVIYTVGTTAVLAVLF